MIGLKRSALAAICFTAIFGALNAPLQGQVVVDHSTDGYRLMVDGQPYLVKGVGGDSYLPALKAAGGNTIRTWSTDNLAETLEQAAANGLRVCVGFWLGHERHGFSYQDADSVSRQLDDCLATIRKFKDHPAVLMWAFGNEMEGDGKNPAIWYAIDHLARESKTIDPNHPTMTVIAELGEDKLQQIERFCPSIDIVGINSYGGASTVFERYRATGISKPYLLTEFGPLGPWEVGKTRWGSAIEPTSTEKGLQYRRAYEQAVTQAEGFCLGSFAFLWGHKQETTATWFGMFLPDGKRLSPVDMLAELWTGRTVTKPCPQIQAVHVSKADLLKPSEKISVGVDASGRSEDILQYEWVLRFDSGTVGVGGDFQAAENAFPNAIAGTGANVQVTLPESGGAYRLFVYVSTNDGRAAVANIPLFVDAPMIARQAERPKLPHVLYDDGFTTTPYTPSGYMGNTNAITMNPSSEREPREGSNCLQIDYAANDGWGGVVWQSPPNDWQGNLHGGFDLSKATHLEFWARGETGDEVVSFMLGIVEGDALYRDTARLELKDVRLTNQWQRLRIPLRGNDVSRIKTGFAWTVAGQGKPIRFYLDQIQYVSDQESL